MPELGVVIHGKSNGSKFCLEPAEQAILMETLAQYPGKLDFVIRRPLQEREINQNNYYWGVVLALISEASGHAVAKLHKHFKEQLLGPDASTKKLSKKDFANYVEQIRAWAATWNIKIPDPLRVEILKT